MHEQRRGAAAGLKHSPSGADIAAAMVDRRLLEHWQRERAARTRLRRALPRSWRDDPRPKMEEVRELYVEAMLEMSPRPTRSVALGDDDR